MGLRPKSTSYIHEFFTYYFQVVFYLIYIYILYFSCTQAVRRTDAPDMMLSVKAKPPNKPEAPADTTQEVSANLSDEPKAEAEEEFKKEEELKEKVVNEQEEAFGEEEEEVSKEDGVNDEKETDDMAVDETGNAEETLGVEKKAADVVAKPAADVVPEPVADVVAKPVAGAVPEPAASKPQADPVAAVPDPEPSEKGPVQKRAKTAEPEPQVFARQHTQVNKEMAWTQKLQHGIWEQDAFMAAPVAKTKERHEEIRALLSTQGTAVDSGTAVEDEEELEPEAASDTAPLRLPDITYLWGDGGRGYGPLKSTNYVFGAKHVDTIVVEWQALSCFGMDRALCSDKALALCNGNVKMHSYLSAYVGQYHSVDYGLCGAHAAPTFMKEGCELPTAIDAPWPDADKAIMLWYEQTADEDRYWLLRPSFGLAKLRTQYCLKVSHAKYKKATWLEILEQPHFEKFFDGGPPDSCPLVLVPGFAQHIFEFMLICCW